MFKRVCDQTLPRLMRGHKHMAVRLIQDALNKNGFYLSVDGDFGQHTERAVAKFQRQKDSVKGATAGVVGPGTLAALGVAGPVATSLAKAPPQHVGNGDWHGKLSYARDTMGGTVVDPNTGATVPAVGKAWVLAGYKDLVGGRVTNDNNVWDFHGPDDPDRTTIGNNECARLVQAFGCSLTRYWRRGPQVKSLSHIPPGTVIATLRDGVYWNDHSGRSHVGIFDSFILGANGTRTGFRMYDQSNHADIALRSFKFASGYDPNKLYEKKKPSAHGDLTIPVPGDDGSILGYTVIHDDYYKSHKYKRQAMGEEYYVMYSTTEPNLVML